MLSSLTTSVAFYFFSNDFNSDILSFMPSYLISLHLYKRTVSVLFFLPSLLIFWPLHPTSSTFFFWCLLQCEWIQGKQHSLRIVATPNGKFVCKNVDISFHNASLSLQFGQGKLSLSKGADIWLSACRPLRYCQNTYAWQQYEEANFMFPLGLASIKSLSCWHVFLIPLSYKYNKVISLEISVL